MLKLCAANLHEERKTNPDKPLTWVDVGGGTGWNIEQMDQYFPIKEFSAVYLVDLTPSLCKVAKDRFQKKGWSNVHVICQDATYLTLPSDHFRSDSAPSSPNETSHHQDPGMGQVDLITMSYALSMIPSFFSVLDRISDYLNPDTGFFGVVDFYVSGRESSPAEKAVGGIKRQCSWPTRVFWQIWFDFDHINLNSARREYLEYKFGTIKSFNGRNHFVVPYLIRIPYYVWIGCSRTRITNVAAVPFEPDSISISGSAPSSAAPSPYLRPMTISHCDSTWDLSRPIEDGSHGRSGQQTAVVNLSLGLPASSFSYQSRAWRLPYDPTLKQHTQFRNYVYAFTWEDPAVDLKYLDITPDDSMLVITSAGDNALDYAINAKPKRIHCVDMNPCQGHLLELKLAAIQGLDYESFWRLFGEGKAPEFGDLLDLSLSSFLSSHAYQYWKAHSNAFDSSFYKTGYSGWALRLAEFLFNRAHARADLERFCEAGTLEEQAKIWSDSLRKIFIRGGLTKLILANPLFLWNSLGVPMNQMQMFMDEGSTAQYLSDTLDPIACQTLLRNSNYFYYLCLMQKYSRDSCPSYLTPEGFLSLKENGGESLNRFRIHTDTISAVLASLAPTSITKAIIMDHLDWFANAGDASASEPLFHPPEAQPKEAPQKGTRWACEVEEEVIALRRVLKVGGMVLWRSAAREPWYRSVFEHHGFKVECMGVRESGGGKAILLDRVNM